MKTLVAAAAVLLVTISASAQTPVTAPDSPAGKALTKWIETFNKGGAIREAYLREDTTLDASQQKEIHQVDTQLLAEQGAVTLVKVTPESATRIVGIIKHAKSGLQGRLEIEADVKAPHKVLDMNLRGATEADLK